MNKILFIAIRLFYVAADILCVCAAILIASWIRQGVFSFDINIQNIFFDQTNTFHLIFLSWPFTVVFFNGIHKLYQTRREVMESAELWQIIQSVFLSAVTILVLAFSLKIVEFPRTVFALTAAFSTLFLCTWRILKRLFVEYLAAHGYNNFNVAIIGAGRIGMTLAKELESRPGLGLKVVGFFDDFKATKDLPKRRKVLGKIEQFRNIAKREFINKIFITVHHDSKVFYSLLEASRELGIAVRVVPQAFDLTTGDIFKYNIGIIPILEYCDIRKKVHWGKGIFDFFISFFIVTALMPIYCVLAILVKLDSKGPVFYKSKRYGLNGKIFNMYKFRSMVSDADQRLSNLKDLNEVDGPIFKIKKDPRITKFGAFLRKYSLDELPQFVNVLKGDMSIVGPRPFPIAQIEKEDLRQLKRLEVKPGITGLWQIRGRSDVSFNKLVKWDIWYINNWTFWLDLAIMFQTVPVVLKGRGAY